MRLVASVVLGTPKAATMTTIASSNSKKKDDNKNHHHQQQQQVQTLDFALEPRLYVLLWFWFDLSPNRFTSGVLS